MMGSDGRGGRKGLSLVGQEADVAFYVRHAGQVTGPVLVLGCANARVAAAIARTGARVLAVDPSERMIAAAEERRAQEPVPLDGLRLLVADLRALRLQERFELVLAPQNAVGLMSSYDDLAALVATAAHHLAPQGSFVFDARGQPPAILWESSRNDDPQLPTLAEPRRPVFSPHLQERTRTPQQREGRHDKGIRRLRLRHFTSGEVDQALQEAGLSAHERFGDFDGKPHDEKDELQIVVAQRR